MSFTSHLSNLKDNFMKRKVLCKDILNVSFISFMKMVDQCNDWSNDIAGKTKSLSKMNFYVIPTSVNSVFWRIKGRIEFKKLECASRNILKSRILKLHQFLLVYQEIKVLMHISDYDNFGLQYSILVQRVNVNSNRKFSTSSDTVTSESNECSICLNQAPDVILPCGHGYCSNCTNKWSKVTTNINSTASNWEVLQSIDHDCWCSSDNSVTDPDLLINHMYNGGKFSCPDCRGECSSDNELWNLLDKPSSDECRLEMKKALDSLVENYSAIKK